MESLASLHCGRLHSDQNTKEPVLSSFNRLMCFTSRAGGAGTIAQKACHRLPNKDLDKCIARGR